MQERPTVFPRMPSHLFSTTEISKGSDAHLYQAGLLQLSGGKTFRLRHFGVELILFAQPCIKGSVGFSDKYSSQIIGEGAIGGEFEILVVRFISYHLQRPQIGNTGRVFNETARSWLPPKRVPKKIPLFRGLGTVQATFVRRGLICRVKKANDSQHHSGGRPTGVSNNP